MLRHRPGAGAGGDRDRDAARSCGVEVDLVDSDAPFLDQPDLLAAGDQASVDRRACGDDHLGGPHQCELLLASFAIREMQTLVGMGAGGYRRAHLRHHRRQKGDLHPVHPSQLAGMLSYTKRLVNDPVL